MASENHANYAKVGLTLVLGTVAIIATLIYFGGMGDRRNEIVCETYYNHPVTGLSVGSEVNFRGVKVGVVRDISFVSAEYDEYAEDDAQVIVIRMALNRRLCRLTPDESGEELLAYLVERGLRATVSSSGITGLSRLDLNLPRAGAQPAPVRKLSWQPDYLWIPPEPSMFESFSDSVMEVVNQVKGMDFRTAWSNLSSIAASAASVAENADAIVDSQRAGIGAIVADLESAARAVKALTEDLRANPSLLLRPRDPEPLPETTE